MECELKITAGQGKIVIRGNSSLITGNPLQHKEEILDGIEKVFLILGGGYQIVKVTEAGNGTLFEFTRGNSPKGHGVYAMPRSAEKFIRDNRLFSPQDKDTWAGGTKARDDIISENISDEKKGPTTEKEDKNDSQKNPYFDRFEIHGTEVFWKRKVIFFKNGKKVKTITGWKDHMYCTDCLFEKNKIVDLLTMPDETVNCPFCNGPMLEVS